MDFLFSIIGFILVIGILVTIHEWGHFQTARWFDVKVTHFSIGFGKPIKTWQGAETQYQIAAIPLGGYVRFLDERVEPVSDDEIHRSFNQQSVYKRFAIVAAGPAINLIFAFIVFTGLNWVGDYQLKPLVTSESTSTQPNLASQMREQTLYEITHLDDQIVRSWSEIRQFIVNSAINGNSSVKVSLNELNDSFSSRESVIAFSYDLNDLKIDPLTSLDIKPAHLPIPVIIGQILEDSPADKFGLKIDDEILALGKVEINNWNQFVKIIQENPNSKMLVTIKRDNTIMQIPVMIENQSGTGKVGIGIKHDFATLKPYMNQMSLGFSEGIAHAMQQMLNMTTMTFLMIKKLILGEVGVHNLSGPISIAQYSGQAVQSGLISFFNLLAILSLSIGLLNLLPIPVLDGGHLLYYIVEMIKGSPVSESIMNIGQVFGLFVLVSLTFLTIFYDVLRLTD